MSSLLSIGVFNQRAAAVSYDADATAYLNAIAIPNDGTVFYTGTAYERTGAQIWTYTNDIFVGLKADGLFAKTKAMYLMLGGTATSHRYNAKDPRTLAAAFYLNFAGGWGHTATGAKPNGSTGYADTNFNPAIQLPTTDAMICNYSRTNLVDGGGDMGAISTTGGLNKWYLIRNERDSDGGASNINEKSAGFTGSTDTIGFYVGSKTATNILKVYKNGTLLSTNSATVAQPYPNLNAFIGCYNAGGGPFAYTARETAFVAFGNGLTDAEVANLYTRVQTFQTALGRNV